MYSSNQDISALISSRICHDLISPLGAISNGLELLAMSQQETSPELELIGESIASANSKIRFFRIAFGHAPNGSMMAQPEIASVLKDYFATSRLEATWIAQREVQRRDAKVLFLAILCLESALPFGGVIEIDHAGENWILSAVSEKLRANPEHWRFVEGAETGTSLPAAQVHFALLAQLTQWRKPALSIDITENDILIRL